MARPCGTGVAVRLRPVAVRVFERHSPEARGRSLPEARGRATTPPAAMAMREPEASWRTSARRGGCGRRGDCRRHGPDSEARTHDLPAGPETSPLAIRGRRVEVNLTQCPYDGAKVEVEVSSGGSLLLTCVACDAVWERHGAWTGRVREPDREKLLAARLHGPATGNGATVMAGEPLPMVFDLDV